MSDDLKSTLDRGLRGFEPSPEAFERTMRRVDRKERTRRIGAGVLALAIVAVAAGSLVRAFEGDGRSAGQHRTGSPAPAVTGTATPTLPKALEAEIVGLDGRTQRRINGLPPYARQLALSPDGNSIAFTIPTGHAPHAPPTVSLMGVLSIDTGRWSAIGWGDSKWEALGADSPSWSPDGKSLAFVATTWAPAGQGRGIDVATLSGGSFRRLTGALADPRWSPDGKALVYVQVGRGDQIYVVTVHGAGPRRLAAGTFPVFSPDGSKIAFVAPDNRIVILNSDGTGPLRYLSGLSHPEALAWSPDGTKIAFLSGSCGALRFPGQGVSTVEVATGAVTTVVQCRVGGVGSGPSWLPSSNALLVGGL